MDIAHVHKLNFATNKIKVTRGGSEKLEPISINQGLCKNGAVPCINFHDHICQDYHLALTVLINNNSK